MMKIAVVSLFGAVLILLTGCTTQERMKELVQCPDQVIQTDWSQPVGSLSAGDSRSYNR